MRESRRRARPHFLPSSLPRIVVADPRRRDKASIIDHNSRKWSDERYRASIFRLCFDVRRVNLWPPSGIAAVVAGYILHRNCSSFTFFLFLIDKIMVSSNGLQRVPVIGAHKKVFSHHSDNYFKYTIIITNSESYIGFVNLEEKDTKGTLHW